MPLSSDLISQFAKSTKDDSKKKNESTVYGTIVEYEGSKYIKIDGSELLTPISLTANGQQDDRVTATIKNHSVVVTGNLTSPSATDREVGAIGSQVTEFETVIADKVDTIELNAVKADIVKLNAGQATIGQLEASVAEIYTLTGDYAEFKDATVEDLNAVKADIKNLNVGDLSTKYANIDFANIGEAAIEAFLSKSGLIENLTVGDSTVTGELVGVTIKGDLIEANTLKADKLVIKGSDGLYYKLNFESGNFTGGEAVPTDSLHGSVITANSITAEKISVKDLVAFGATIGSFEITDAAIHSFAKDSADNTTRGVYMDKDGQFVVGDNINYIKYYKLDDGTYALDISAANLKLGGSDRNLTDAIEDLEESVNNFSVGGRNYLLKTEKMASWNKQNVTLVDDMGDRVADFGKPTSTSWTCYIQTVPRIKYYAIRGKTMTLSMMVRSDDWTDVQKHKLAVIPALFTSSGSKRWCHEFNEISIPNEWTRYSWTITVNDDFFDDASFRNKYPDFVIDDTVLFGVQVFNYSTSHLQIKHLKLEEGTVATDWSPSPEDFTTTEYLIANYYDKVDMDAQLQVTTDSITSSVSEVYATQLDLTAVGEKIDNLEVGGRNLISISGISGTNVTLEVISTDHIEATGVNESDASRIIVGTEVEPGTYTFNATGSVSGKSHRIAISTQIDDTWTLDSTSELYYKDVTLPITFECSESFDIGLILQTSVGDQIISGIKLEKGDLATDWTPSPEDQATSVAESANNLESKIINVESVVTQLSNSISSLIRDSSGTSLMTQTTEGWMFNISSIENNLKSAMSDINELDAEMKDTEGLIKALNSTVADLGTYTNYIKFGTEGNQPCIILGTSNSAFKVVITNTEIRFMEGSVTPAYINNQSLYVSKAVISEELKQGEFVWMARANGNYGLLWRGE